MFRGDKYVTPLYRLDEREVPEQGASGVWIALGTERFLFTAAHAIDDGFVWFPMKVGFKRIDSPGFRATSSDGTQMEDRADFAVFHLQDRDLEAMHPFHEFVSVEHLAVNYQHREGDRFEFTGYPYRRERLNRATKQSTPGYTSISSIAVSQERFRTLGVVPQTHVAIRYDREQMLKDGIQVTGPLPEGISGGAVWKRYDGDEVRRLAAIATEFRQDCLIGVRISAALEFIRKAFPSLAEIVPSQDDIEIRITRNGQPGDPGAGGVSEKGLA